MKDYSGLAKQLEGKIIVKDNNNRHEVFLAIMIIICIGLIVIFFSYLIGNAHGREDQRKLFKNELLERLEKCSEVNKDITIETLRKFSK